MNCPTAKQAGRGALPVFSARGPIPMDKNAHLAAETESQCRIP